MLKRMDNLCHTLVGAAIGEAGLKRRTRFGNAALMLSANLPDVDALIFLTGAPSVAFRRGWTHGIVAQALWPLALTTVLVIIDRVWRPSNGDAPRAGPGPLLLLSGVGILSHVFLDFLNNYGVRLLMPFSRDWFYGDAVFIIDPWLWLVLGAGVLWARRRRTQRPARVALGVAGVYVAAMLALAAASRRTVLDVWIRAHGAPPRGLMVGPAPVDPVRKTIIVDAGDRYATGTFDWWRGDVRFDAAVIMKNDTAPAVARARDHPAVEAILVWARFPYYETEPSDAGTRVTIRDVRFGDRVGATTVTVHP